MNALRLLFGTLTILPVQPPSSVDRRTAGWAMTLAPLAGLFLAIVVVVPLGLLDEYDVSKPPLLTAVLVIGALAILTRAIHLDGLADVADGLGSGKRGEDALAIMKKSDIGPFGVVTLVLVLLVQVAALAECLAAGTGVYALTFALVMSRAMLPVVCTGVFLPARPDGLGVAVAGSVRGWQALSALLGAIALGALALWPMIEQGWVDGQQTFRDPGPGVALVAALVLADRAKKRFGGMTGDVYGAVVEVAFTAMLVTAAFAY